MPSTTETPVKAFAHCPDARCRGANQERVDAFRVVTEYKYGDSGGDLPFVEKSFEHLRFAEDVDRECKSCGRSREVTASQRKSYAPLSGHDPMGLLGANAFNPAQAPEDPRVAELERKLAELTAKLGG